MYCCIHNGVDFSGHPWHVYCHVALCPMMHIAHVHLSFCADIIIPKTGDCSANRSLLQCWCRFMETDPHIMDCFSVWQVHKQFKQLPRVSLQMHAVQGVAVSSMIGIVHQCRKYQSWLKLQGMLGSCKNQSSRALAVITACSLVHSDS